MKIQVFDLLIRDAFIHAVTRRLVLLVFLLAYTFVFKVSAEVSRNTSGKRWYSIGGKPNLGFTCTTDKGYQVLTTQAILPVSLLSKRKTTSYAHATAER
jgi:hypothetical protein